MKISKTIYKYRVKERNEKRRMREENTIKSCSLRYILKRS